MQSGGASINQHFTATQLAGLPGMKKNARYVRELARQQNWAYVFVDVVGGKAKAYSIDCLPLETQQALGQNTKHAPEDPAITAEKLRLKDDLTARANRTKKAQSLIDSHSLPPAQQQVVDARLALLRALELYAQQHGIGLRQAEHDFAAGYSQGRIALDADVHAQINTVSAASLQRWRLALRRDGVLALADGYGGRRGKNKVDDNPELRDLILAVMVRKPHVRTTHIMQIIQARFGDATPSKATVQRWMANWRNTNHQTYTALTNPDRWKDRYMVAHGSASENITRLNQLWELDSTPADVMLTDGRHSIIGVIDVYSRRTVLLVSKTSQATAVCLAVRQALLDWGVAEKAKTDRGADYTSKHVTRVFAALDIEQELCPPFQGWRKPHIERFFGSFTRDLVELLDNYIGHNVADRRELESRKSFADRLMTKDDVIPINMSSAELQQFCDDWLTHIYEHRSHSGLGGKTPFQMAAAWREPVVRIENERMLDILLAEAPQNNGRRSVQKKGIELDGAWFIAPELEQYVRETVQVRFDPHDLGRIYVFGGPDLEFICIAECPERTGIDRTEIAALARAKQTKRVQEERAALKAATRKIKTDDLVGEIVRSQAEKNGKLAMFPQRGDAHTSGGIRAAEAALAALDAPRFEPADVMDTEAFEARRAKLESAREQAAQPVFETAFQRCYWIAQQSAERDLSSEESDYMAEFKRANPRGYADIKSLIEDRAGVNSDAG